MVSRRKLLLLTASSAAIAASCGIQGMLREDLAKRVESDFKRHASRDDFTALSPKEGIDLMSSFLHTVKYKHDTSTRYGDTLLFEYGVYDWGQGENFDLKITRQIVFESPSSMDADDYIIQFSLTFKYAPDPFRHLVPVTQWASDLPGSQTIESLALASQGYAIASTMQARQIELYSSAQ
jgi:hypothetical protein